MRLEDLPAVGAVVRSGARDRALDALLALGPVVLLCIALFGRGALTSAFAAAYVLVFVGYVGYKGWRTTSR